jgi:lysophospholipase L1-like esterase
MLPLAYLLGRLGGRVDLRTFPTSVLAIALALMVGTLGGTAACSGQSAPGTPVASTPAPHRTSGPPLHVLFVGASITSGWYAGSGHDYRSLVEQDLTQRGYSLQVQTWARPGTRVASLAHFVPPTGMELIVLQLATNDSGSGRPADPSVFATEYSGLVQRLRAASPGATLVCLDAWANAATVNRLGVPVAVYDQAVERACTGAGGHFVDLSAAYQVAAYHGPAGRPTPYGPSDWFHPNDGGHARVASLVLAAASPLPQATKGGITSGSGL